jgi:uncharacterized coiled-coil DUF342 family protein
MTIPQFGKIAKQNIQVAMQCLCQLHQAKQLRMLIQVLTINGYFYMFDLTEIEARIEQSEKTLIAISDKIKDMRNDFNEIYSELENKDDTYFEEHSNERNELNEKIRKRMSVYDLLKETAETIRTQTKKDMQLVFEELQKKHFYN